MKISKILPLALAMLLATTCANAYTGGTESIDTPMTITLPEYLHIERIAKVDTANVTNYGTHYNQINLDAAMSATFKVSTNHNEQKIYLRAKTLAGSDPVPALGGTAASPVIVFANQTHAATAEAVTNALSDSPAVNKNANAIAFVITKNITAVAGDTNAATTAPAEAIQPDGTGKEVEYTLHNGIYTFKYDLAQTGKANTFSTHDEDGTYTTTLTLTNIGAGA